jgi:N-methylhydantoinase A
MLAFGELAAGVRLDVERARRSLEPLAERLSIDVEHVARGIMTIAAEAMANAIRSVTIDQGHDARQATLIAFGGAGPLFATLLSRALEIGTVVIPNYAGNFSAWGLLGQDLKRSAALTSIRPLDAAGIDEANSVLQGLYRRIDAERTATYREPALDLRYAGQEYTLTITPPAAADGSIPADADAVFGLFAGSYERTFGHTLDQPVEIVVTRATARTPLPRRSSDAPANEPTNRRLSRTIDAYSFRAGTRLPFSVVPRAELGAAAAGPMIVSEETATTFVDVGFGVSVDPTGSIVLTDQGSHEP